MLGPAKATNNRISTSLNSVGQINLKTEAEQTNRFEPRDLLRWQLSTMNNPYLQRPNRTPKPFPRKPLVAVRSALSADEWRQLAAYAQWSPFWARERGYTNEEISQ